MAVVRRQRSLTSTRSEQDRSFDAIAHDAENLYLVSNSPGLGSIADVYPYSKLGTAGRRFALEGIADNLGSAFESVKGAVFLNEEIVVLLQRTVGAARLSMARFRPDGSYVSNSFTVLGLPSEADPRGMTLAGNQVFVLDATRILALDRGFAYVCERERRGHQSGPGLGGLERERATGL